MARFRQHEDDGLDILLSAVSSVLRGTGAIHEISEGAKHSWAGGREVMVNASIVASKVNPMDVAAIRAAMLGYAPTQATIDEMRKRVEDAEKEPDRAELLQLRRDKATLEQRLREADREIARNRDRVAAMEQRIPEMDRRLREAEQRTATSTSSSARIANLESEIANLRKQLAIGPPVQDDGRDPGEVRASLLELT